MLQNADEYRSWALLGFLACPSALAGVGARPALAGLLSETLLMHVYADHTEAVHPLYEQHVRPNLEKLTEVGGAAGQWGRRGQAMAVALAGVPWRA